MKAFWDCVHFHFFLVVNIQFYMFVRLVYIMNNFMITYPEPVGSVSPKVNIGDGLIFRKDIGQTLDLLCPAQAFPVPVIRYITIFMNLAFNLLYAKIKFGFIN